LFLVLIASEVLVGALWNEFLPWDRLYALQNVAPKEWGCSLVKEELIKAWADSQMIAVSVLGLRFSVDDIQVLGSLLLFVLTFYYCMCSRRENREIGWLLRDSTEADNQTKEFIVRGIYAGAVLSLAGNDDDPIERLASEGPQRRSAATESSFRALLLSVIGAPGKRIFFARGGLGLLTYAPVFVVASILASDLYFLLAFVSPYHLNASSNWADMPQPHKVQLIVHDAVALLMAVPIAGYCRRIVRYRVGAEAVLREFRRFQA